MKRIYIPIFKKLIIVLILTVATFGFLNVYFVWNNVFSKFESEVEKRVIRIGTNLSAQSEQFILLNDIPSLHNLMENNIKSDSIIVYCFILNRRKEILVHSFKDFPNELLNIKHKINSNDSASIVNIKAKNFKTDRIKDVSIPIMQGNIGYVRIGIKDNVYESILQEPLIYFIVVFIIFTVIGLLGSYWFSKFLTSPISKLKSIAENINLNNIGLSKNQIHNHIIQQSKTISVQDELDELTNTVYSMLERMEQTYNQLIETQSAMQQSEKLASIGTLVAGLAHEINNPLSGLQSCLRRIQNNPQNLQQNIKYIEIMNESSFKISKVVNELLNFSRVSNSSKELCNINDIINNSLSLISIRRPIKRIDIVSNISDSKLMINCNKNEIEQVIFNLLKNAYDAIEDKLKIDDNFLPAINIEVNRKYSEAIIEIIDNGIGIDKHNLTKIFDPFYTTKDVGKGTGLGCSICYKIINEHKGDISVDSTKFEKTKFTIKLPLMDNQNE